MQLYIVLEIFHKCTLLTNVVVVAVVVVMLLLQKQLAMDVSLFVFSLFLETVSLLYGINIHISIYDAVSILDCQ